ncbi:unnamed protein product [Rotaria socialis]|uniref:Uncharacterized protein n=1 Tax=Rotaria socialis TaxID=392032 RepID=A0A820XLQ2_9BILA|nr:unnamed protein product [Rotaria socialis]CAF3322058.1 unnamed protein product [Rotaria socialis]CAF3355260.1 unnamed protein product [Rotaria socialis]CAF3639052.1 unnamed protein product [Rotaria socialis]CAF3714312.1 unnamed protein product [Rotaria socialis]
MIKYLVPISFSLVLWPIDCQTVRTNRMKNSQETCFGSHGRTNSTHHLQICYFYDLRSPLTLIWFTIEKRLSDIFDAYRFILRTTDGVVQSNEIIQILTNFTELIDYNNSLRIFNLNSGVYEVCIELYMNSTRFIYQPRDGCAPIRTGKLSPEPLKANSMPLLVALASGIVMFFILGLVVQWVQARYRRQHQHDDKPRARSSSGLSTTSLKQKRDRLLSLFHRRIDKPNASWMRQWARAVAFRHRISTQQKLFKRTDSSQNTNEYLRTTIDTIRARPEKHSRHRRLSSEATISTDRIYTISDKVHHHVLPGNFLFNLSVTEENEITSSK